MDLHCVVGVLVSQGGRIQGRRGEKETRIPGEAFCLLGAQHVWPNMLRTYLRVTRFPKCLAEHYQVSIIFFSHLWRFPSSFASPVPLALSHPLFSYFPSPNTHFSSSSLLHSTTLGVANIPLRRSNFHGFFFSKGDRYSSNFSYL